jgi:lysozyme family protein
MADFEIAFNKTMGHEGRYVNDSDDAGGETYMGISRKYNPLWDGWELIDESKRESDFPRCLDDDEDLQDEVELFYEQRYWDVNNLDYFPQSTAEEMFDTGVNCGTKQAAKWLQESLNYLNRNESSYNDLVTDGVIGPSTMQALNYIVKHDDEEILLKIMNTLQGNHYLEYMKKSPTQEKYARGWFSRVTMFKEN